MVVPTVAYITQYFHTVNTTLFLYLVMNHIVV